MAKKQYKRTPQLTSAQISAIKAVCADRVRQCAICGNPFWALRVNSECCTEKCRKTYNQRNSRAHRSQINKMHS